MRFVAPLSFATLLLSPLIFYTWSMVHKLQSFWFKDIDLLSLLSTFSYIIAPPMERPVGFMILFYGILIYTLIRFRKNLDDRHLQFALYLFLPIITMWLVSQVFPFYHHRYFLFGGMSLFVLVGWGVQKIGKIEIEFEHCFMGFVFFILFLSSTFFYNTFNTELHDSATFLYNYTKNDTEDFMLIHTSTFSQSPYKIYYSNRVNLLKTNLTREQMFTAGGSIVEDYEIITTDNNITEDIIQYHSYFQNHSIYLVSDRIAKGEVIYSEGGLYVTKIR